MANDQIFDTQARADMPEGFNPKPQGFFSKYKIAIFAVIAALLVVGIFWFFLSQGGPSTGPHSSNVVLTTKGPDQIASGNEAEYTITYRNGENADLVSVSLEMLYPSGFVFKSADPEPTTNAGGYFNLPILKQGKDGSVVIRGKLSGASGEDKEIKAILHYRLSNFNSEFQVSQSAHTVITAPNLVLDLSGPVDVVNGQNTTFAATITNVSGQSFENVALEVAYPEGFEFSSSNMPPAQNNNYWKLGHLDTGATQSIEITGSFAGADNEEKLVKASLGQIINNNFAPQIVSTVNFHLIPSSLGLTLSDNLNGQVKLGDTVSYKLDYENRGRIGLNNVVITVNIDSLFVDYARVQATNAIITDHTLTWKAASLPSLSTLSPNESGQVTFNIPTKTTLGTNLKNQGITVSANIISDEINVPTKASQLVSKLVSIPELAIQGDLVSGAVPMQVGQTTTFAVTFLLSNLSNDLADTVVIASMPLPSSAWNNIIVPESEASRLSFDPNSGKIMWRIGGLSAFTGKFSPVLQATFQLAVTPSESDRGNIMTLLSDIQVSATDTYINQSVQSKPITSVNVNSLGDDSFQNTGATVQ